ncbi:uncharacterized protein LOC113295797 [Papaver somniferum]|uniref:uncharacterized protein LOC113295797 n=1 Tax=Papaver somniferum TaxID=3469 RepID=UPI000E6F67E1|nr:uncharacterized protein LOC113295797 [Papaver somniferum]
MIEQVLAQKQSREERLQVLAMKRSMDSPFVEEIRQFRPPANFVQPQFKELFDGKSDDPVEHLESNSISNFGMLSDAFFEQDKINLGSKKAFNQRFRQEVGEVGVVDAGIIIEAYKNAFPYDEFRIFNSLIVQPVGNLKELYAREDSYARAEKEKREKLSQTKGAAEMPSKVRCHPEEDSKKKNRESSKIRNEETSESKIGQRKDGVKFPSLNIGLGELHKKIRDSLPIPIPLFEDTKGKRDKSKFCAYHNDHGHTTDTCRTLASEVQKLVDEGKLQQYVKKDPSRINALNLQEIFVSHAKIDSASRKAHENATRLKIRQIQDWRILNKVDYVNLIGTETLEEGKTEISFINADFDGVYRPHNDTIVILTLIGMYKVRRVLIDTGSSISVIFSGAYSSMNLNEGQVEADDNPIVGFSGETVSAVGRVNLPTTVGGNTVMQYFSLLDCRAPYNAILGLDWINSMEVITSTVHQCLKFVTPTGVVKVRSDQVESHKCHESAMEEYRKSEVKAVRYSKLRRSYINHSISLSPIMRKGNKGHRRSKG